MLSLFDPLIEKLAGAAGLSWLKLLPWGLLGLGIAVGGAGAWGWREGARVTAAAYETQKAQAAQVSAQAFATSLQRTATISESILSSALTYLEELNLARYKRAQVVKKVTDDVKAHIAADCRLPAATLELRKQQVDESAAVYAADHPM
ncbi:MAG TPA: hypothetical protein VFB54_03600 [Burkholderiales bacterium]|jgi:ribosomal protein L15|nr:hypothetical protein [Burkholderiales bacterium]